MRLQILYVRSQSLKDEVRLLKEKEAKDTKALDDMVQKIEENLKIATVSNATILSIDLLWFH